jgi:hypothetical protein
MPRWLMKFSVEAHLGVEPGTSALSFHHPDGRYEVHLENLQMDPGHEDPSRGSEQYHATNSLI